MEYNVKVPPLRIYLLWHPDFTGKGVLPEPKTNSTDGPQTTSVMELADSVVEKFKRLGGALPMQSGIQVELRSFSDPQRKDKERLPREIPEGKADKTLVVPLVDSSMINDEAWNRWIRELYAREHFVVMPVALADYADQWTVIRGKQPIRLLGSKNDVRPIEKRKDELIRQLLIKCIKLLSRANADSNPQVFFSYHDEEGNTTESSGGAIAKLLFDKVVNDCLGLGAFFAPLSITPLEDYEQTIRVAVEEADAVVSVCTSEYFRRTWCRQEVGWAREPRRIAEGKDCWQTTPLIVVIALGTNYSHVVPEFGGCQMIGWHPDNALQILDKALTEAVATANNRRWAEKLSAEGRVVLSWNPDALSLLKLRSKGHLPDRCTIVYPGDGMPNADRKFFEAALGGVTIHTFDEMRKS